MLKYVVDSDINAELERFLENYNTARDSFITAEDRTNTFPIGVANEFRAVLYHLAKSLQSEKKDEILKQLDEANDHLVRIIYDSSEVAFVYLAQEILDYSNIYSKKALSNVCPEYYSKMLPFINEQREIISQERTKRNKWENYKNAISTLVVFKSDLYKKKVALEKETFSYRELLVFVIGVILGSFLIYFVF